MLSIVWRGSSWQVRYASSNPYGVDRPPYLCSDEGTLVALLHHCGTDAWATQQAVAVLRQGKMAVLPIVSTEAQLQAYFPLPSAQCIHRQLAVPVRVQGSSAEPARSP
jgi:hypothetical protein